MQGPKLNTSKTLLEKTLATLQTTLITANKASDELKKAATPQAIINGLLNTPQVAAFMSKQNWAEISALTIVELMPPISLEHGVAYSQLWRKLQDSSRKDLIEHFRVALGLNKDDLNDHKLASALYYCLASAKVAEHLYELPALSRDNEAKIRGLYQVDNLVDYSCPIISPGELDDQERLSIYCTALEGIEQRSVSKATTLRADAQAILKDLNNASLAVSSGIFDMHYKGQYVLDRLKDALTMIIKTTAQPITPTVTQALIAPIYTVMATEEAKLRTKVIRTQSEANADKLTLDNIDKFLAAKPNEDKRRPYLNVMKKQLTQVSDAVAVRSVQPPLSVSAPPFLQQNRKVLTTEEKYFLLVTQAILSDQTLDIPRLKSIQTAIDAGAKPLMSYRDWKEFGKALSDLGQDWVRERREILGSLFKQSFAEKVFSIFHAVDLKDTDSMNKAAQEIVSLYSPQLQGVLKSRIGEEEKMLLTLYDQLNSSINGNNPIAVETNIQLYTKAESTVTDLLAAVNRFAEIDPKSSKLFDTEIAKLLALSDGLQESLQAVRLHNRVIQIEKMFADNEHNFLIPPMLMGLRDELDQYHKAQPPTSSPKLADFLKNLYDVDEEKMTSMEDQVFEKGNRPRL